MQSANEVQLSMSWSSACTVHGGLRVVPREALCCDTHLALVPMLEIMTP